MTNQPNIFLTHDYHNFTDYVRNVNRWNLDFRKLDKGSFEAHLEVLDIETVQIIRTQISGLIDQLGAMQPGYRTFVIPSGSLANIHWMNIKIEKNNFIILPKNKLFYAVSRGDFDVFVISIRETHLQEIAKQCNAINLKNNLVDEERVFMMDEESYSTGLELLSQVFNELNNNRNILKKPEFVFHIKYKIPYLIVHFLNNKKLVALKPLKRKRDMALIKCIQFITKHVEKNIQVSSLSKLAKSSERTIEYAFLERYGISPKTYITNVKLNRIKNILSNPENRERVSTIARSFGFHHMGQFSADYKNLLGELPRQTLMNSKV